MNILGIDTTRKNALVFMIDSDNVSHTKVLQTGENIKHSEGVFLYIEKLLLETGLEMKDVDAFACIVGPGSFTGIRVGMSVIKGFCKVYNKPVVSLNTFEVVSNAVKKGVVLLNSTNTSCYYAKIKASKIVDAGVVVKDQVKELSNNETVFVLEEEQLISSLEYNNIKVIDDLSKMIVDSIIERLNSMEYGEFVPYYLQLSQAERILK